MCSDSDEDEIPPPPPLPQDDIPPPPPPLNTTSNWAQIAKGHQCKVGRLHAIGPKSMGERLEKISRDFKRGSKQTQRQQKNKGKKNKKTQVYYDMPN